MAYNFKSIADVEVVAEPSESANVLIEEDGIVKKAPKTAVGGAGGGSKTPDMVITVNGTSTTKIENGNFNITEGSMDAVFEAFHAGRYPIIKIRFYQYENTAYTAIREEYNAYACTYGNTLWISCITQNPYDSACIYVHKFTIDEDGTITFTSLARANLTIL